MRPFRSSTGAARLPDALPERSSAAPARSPTVSLSRASLPSFREKAVETSLATIPCEARLRNSRSAEIVCARKAALVSLPVARLATARMASKSRSPPDSLIASVAASPLSGTCRSTRPLRIAPPAASSRFSKDWISSSIVTSAEKPSALRPRICGATSPASQAESPEGWLEAAVSVPLNERFLERSSRPLASTFVRPGNSTET